MKAFLGLAIVALGVLLLVHGLGAYETLSSQFSQLVSGTRPDRTGWMVIGGVFAVLIGVAITSHPRRPHPKT